MDADLLMLVRFASYGKLFDAVQSMGRVLPVFPGSLSTSLSTSEDLPAFSGLLVLAWSMSQLQTVSLQYDRSHTGILVVDL